MKTIEEKQTEIIEEFSELENWEDKFQYLVELGDELSQYPEDKKKEEFRVKGCESRVWVLPELKEDKLYFLADSDTALTKGLIAILVRVLSGHSPEEISKAKLDFLETIGLKKFLSISRRNGLSSMVTILQNYAQANR
ncbi:MAG: SufE family protein [Leptospiraceae bacterium]|nr:SufE family protein [Leptospiraceae bacterium]